MKKSNYYSIHKNKKKRKSTKTDFQKAWGKSLPIILRAMKFVQQAIEQSQIRIPQYKIEGNPISIVRDYASRAGSNPERVIHSILSQPKNGSEIVFNSSNEPKHWIDNPYLTDEYKKHLLSVPSMEFKNLIEGNWIDEQTEIKREIFGQLNIHNRISIPDEDKEFFTKGAEINLPDNIPLKIGYEKVGDYNDKSFEM